MSNFDAEQLTQALAAGDPVAVQNEYSLLGAATRRELLPLCAERQIAYTVYSPLCGGWLTGKYGRGRPYPAGSRMTQRPEPYAELASEATFAKLEGLEEFAAQRGISMAGVALAWLLGDERIGQIVIGPGRPEHLQPVADAIEHPLTAGRARRLGEAVSMSDVLVLSHADVHAALAPDECERAMAEVLIAQCTRGGVRAAAQRR